MNLPFLRVAGQKLEDDDFAPIFIFPLHYSLLDHRPQPVLVLAGPKSANAGAL
jgi:hypothetical protein